MFKKRIFTKLADSIFTDPSRFLQIRFISNLHAQITGNLRETCQSTKNERNQETYSTNTWLRASNYQIGPINNKAVNTYSIFY